MEGYGFFVYNYKELLQQSYTIDDAVNKIFTKLDEAIDDFENGRVLSEEVVWKQIKRRAITGAGA